MTNFVNLTPHTIVISSSDKSFSIPASGTLARVSVVQEVCGELEGIPLVRTVKGAVENIPASEAGVVYIVSGMVLEELKGSGRTDVVAPDTGATAIRNQKGHIDAVTRLNVVQ
jgi:hypothetical protein